MFIRSALTTFAICLLLSGLAVSQTNNDGNRPSWLFNIAVGPAFVNGDYYDNLDAKTFQAGFRIGAHRFTAKSIALGVSGSAWAMPSDESLTDDLLFTLGPSLFITNIAGGQKLPFFLDIYTHYMQVGLSDGDTGIEIGFRVGGVNAHRGISYAVGWANDAIQEKKGGNRIFIEVGLINWSD